MRLRLMPGARNCRMVTMKLIEPSVVESPSSNTPNSSLPSMISSFMMRSLGCN